jgi:HK97 family phage major capsid protein
MDIDVKVAEAIKQKMDDLGNSIDGKINDAMKKAQESGNAEAAKLTGKVKEEVQAEIKKYNDLNEELTKRLDLIETKAGRFDQVMARKSMADAFMQKLQDEGVKQGYRGNFTLTPKDFEGIDLRKADDMTGSNTFTNNVPGYEHLPEIHFDPDRRNRIRDLILQGTTSMTAIEYIRETAFDDQTDVTAEGAEFNQSDFDLTAYTANVRKITTYIMLSEEMMDDVEGMTSYILARLPGKINKDEDTQILKGSGTGNNLSGLTTNATAYSDNLADTKVQRIDVLVDAVRQVVDDEYTPSAILLNPADFYLIALTKDSNGQYILPWFLGVTQPQLAGVPVVMSTAQTSGVFDIITREAAQVFFRKELTVEFSNQSEDNFIKGMVTVRAQKRLALAIYRPTALLTGTFSVALAQGTG